MVTVQSSGPVNPTLATTFTNYGATAYQVQWWNGSTWLDVPGGNVTGNNLVWRRFTFSPITTDRIRVYVNDAFDHMFSRLIEVEAWSNVYERIGGTATLNGQPMAGVTVAASNGGTCSSSDASGAYSCSVVQGWSGAVTPSLPGYVFVPASRTYASVQANQSAQDYAGTPGTYTLSGTVTANGAPLSGASLSGGAGASCTSSDAAGHYSCTVTGGWSGTITPSLSTFTFTPASLSYTNVVANQSARDYTAAGVTIAGTVRLGGVPLAGAALSGGTGTACTSSDTAGQYVCTVPQGWSGTLMISASGYSFAPALRAYVNAQVNLAGEDFTAAVYAVNNTYYIETDHLNTPRIIANANAITVWRWDQTEPFGDSAPDNNPSGIGTLKFNLRFPGQYADDETSLAQNVQRDYSSALGRYFETDPMGLAGGTEAYGYANASPVLRVDPEGLLSIAACANPANAPACIAAGIIVGPVASAIIAAATNAVLQEATKGCIDPVEVMDVAGDAAQLGILVGPLAASRRVSGGTTRQGSPQPTQAPGGVASRPTATSQGTPQVAPPQASPQTATPQIRPGGPGTEIHQRLIERLREIDSLPMGSMERGMARTNALAEALAEQGYSPSQIFEMLGKMKGGGTGFGF